MQYNFYKEDNQWFINLPDYPGSKADLQMVAGADDMLDVLSEGARSVNLDINQTSQPGSQHLICRAGICPEGGANYLIIQTVKEELRNKQLWLCDVTKYVFGYFPSFIFIKTVAP